MKSVYLGFVPAIMVVYGLSAEASQQIDRRTVIEDLVSEAFRDLRRKSRSRKSSSKICGQYGFVHIIFEPFPGTGTSFIPSTGGLLEPGAKAAILEKKLIGVATYLDTYDGEAIKTFNVIGELKGSCTVAAQDPLFDFTDSGDLIIPESSKNQCLHPPYGSAIASGESFSHWQYNSQVNPFDFNLLGSKGFISVTGANFDLGGATKGGFFTFIHDSINWNLNLKAPLSQDASCKLQEYAYDLI